jgi:hypothetical protein
MFNLVKKIFGTTPTTTQAVIRNPIGNKNLLFRRTTSRYAPKGSFSENVGYFYVSRNPENGRFISRQEG